MTGTKTMKLIQITVAGNIVRTLFVSGDTKENSKQWLEFQAEVDSTEDPYLSELHLRALLHVRAAIDAEMSRLKELANRRS